MTRLLQLTARGLKGVTRTRAGSSVANAARAAAGLCFDMFHAEYRTEGMAFAIPDGADDPPDARKVLRRHVQELPERTLWRNGTCRAAAAAYWS